MKKFRKTFNVIIVLSLIAVIADVEYTLFNDLSQNARIDTSPNYGM